MQRRHLLLLVLMIAARSRSTLADTPPAAYRRRELQASDGKRTSLALAARGTRLLVVVMKSAHCRVCIAQLERLERLSTELGKLGVTVVGLSHESFEECASARRRAKIKSVLLSDPQSHVMRALGLWRQDIGHPMPALVLFDRCGEERGRLVGRRPGQRPEPALLDLLRTLERKPERCQHPNA